MGWSWLAIASACEVVFALASGAARGFTRFWPSVLTVAGAAGGIFSLSLALRSIDLAVAYAVWTGIGTVGTVLASAVLLRRPLTRQAYLPLAAVLLGVLGLRVLG